MSDIVFPSVRQTGSQTLHVDIPTCLTDVTTVTMIPPKSDCQTMLGSLSAERYKAVSCSLGSFKESSLQTLIKIHELIEIKRKVNEEKRWFNVSVPVPNVYCSPPDQALISAYEKLLFENADDKVVLGREIIASDLSCLTSNGWLTLSIVKEFVGVFNKQSSETLVLVLNDLIGLEQKHIAKLLAKEKGKQIKRLTFIVNVGRNGTKTFVAKPGKQGCHWTVMYIDVTTNKWLYCDTLAWAPPDDLTANVNALMNILIPELSLPTKPVQGRFVAHRPESMKAGAHHCSKSCFRNIPLQKCGNVCGVIALIVAAISCMDPKLWDCTFLDIRNKLPNQLQWLLHPTSYASYLRRVLIHWLMAKHVDLKLLGITTYIHQKGTMLESFLPKSTQNEHINDENDRTHEESKFNFNRNHLHSTCISDGDEEQPEANNILASTVLSDGGDNHGDQLQCRESGAKDHLMHHSYDDLQDDTIIDLHIDNDIQGTNSTENRTPVTISQDVEESSLTDKENRLLPEKHVDQIQTTGRMDNANIDSHTDSEVVQYTTSNENPILANNSANHNDSETKPTKSDVCNSSQLQESNRDNYHVNGTDLNSKYESAKPFANSTTVPSHLPDQSVHVSTREKAASTAKIIVQGKKRPIDCGYSGNATEDSKKPKLNKRTQEECSQIGAGSEFHSYAQLEKSIQAFQEKNFVQLYKRSSRGLDAYAKKCPNKKLNPELLYSELDFACIHGGMKFKTKSKGSRPNQQ